MSKFTLLIKNEYQKLIKRKTFWVMLIITFAVSLLISLGVSTVTALNKGWDDYEITWDEIVQTQEQNSKYAFEKDKETGEYIDHSEWSVIDRAHYLAAVYCRDNDYDMNDWRYTKSIVCQMKYFECMLEDDAAMVTVGFEPEYCEEQYEYYKNIVDKNDWKGYLKTSADQMCEWTMPSENRKKAIYFEYDYRTEHDLCPGESWRDNLIGWISSYKSSYASYLDKLDAGVELKADEKKEMERLENEIARGIYRLDHDVEVDLSNIFDGSTVFVDEGSRFWNTFVLSTELIMIIGVMMIIVAGRIVAEEFSQGTIKFLLISPVKRWKILAAKYVTVLSFGLMLFVLYFLSSMLSSMAFTGADGIGGVIVKASHGEAYTASPFVAMLSKYALKALSAFVMATMAFMISSLMKSAVASVGVGIAAYLVGDIVTALFAALGLDFARYFIFSNIDLASIAVGNSVFPHQTIPVALCVISVHMVVFLLTAYDGFVRREI